MTDFPAPVPPSPPAPKTARLRPLLIGAAGVGAVAVALTAGYRAFSDRPGEAALSRLVPADALGAAFMDTRPSSISQWKMLGRLTAAIKNEDLSGEVAQAKEKATGDLKDTPLYQELLPYWSGGAAMGVWGKYNAPRILVSPEGLENGDAAVPADPLNGFKAMIALSVRSPEQVEALVAKQSDAPQKSGGFTLYKLRPSALRQSATAGDTPVYVSIMGPYAVFSESPQSLQTVHDVFSGKTPALTTQKEYTDLRGIMPSDTNALTFVSTEAFRQMSAASNLDKNQSLSDTLAHTHGTAYAATLKENGFALTYVTRTDAPQLVPLAQAAPLSAADFRRIPDGAVAAGVVSQPGKWMEVVRATVQANPQTRKGWDDTVKSLEETTELNVDTQIIPALQGETTVAVYPGTTPGMPFEGLLIVSDANGANPASIVKSLRETMKRDSEKHDQALGESVQKRGDVAIYTITGDAVDELLTPAAKKSGRQIAYAQIGNTVLAATTPDLLQKATAAYPAQNGKTFASAALPTGTQNAFVMLPTKEGLRGVLPLWSELDKTPASAEIRDTLLEAVKDAPLSVTGRYQGGLMTTEMFFPVNPEKAVHALALIIKAQKEQKPSP